jgi:hypothetical protein
MNTYHERRGCEVTRWCITERVFFPTNPGGWPDCSVYVRLLLLQNVPISLI